MLVIVCGLADEKHVAEKSGTLVLCGINATSTLDSLVPAECTGLLSFGACGALSPELSIADLLLGTSITDDEAVHAVDAAWLERLTQGLKRQRPRNVPILSHGVETAHTPEERKALFAKTGCWAVDDESKAVARLAAKRNIPFAVLRAVSDDADSELPLAARNVILPDGTANIEAVLASLRASPLQLFDLQKTAVEYHMAIGRLWDAYRTVGPDYCFERPAHPPRQ
jgi:adenosylhomocysteine nucleosidase